MRAAQGTCGHAQPPAKAGAGCGGSGGRCVGPGGGVAMPDVAKVSIGRTVLHKVLSGLSSRPDGMYV